MVFLDRMQVHVSMHTWVRCQVPLLQEQQHWRALNPCGPQHIFEIHLESSSIKNPAKNVHSGIYTEMPPHTAAAPYKAVPAA